MLGISFLMVALMISNVAGAATQRILNMQGGALTEFSFDGEVAIGTLKCPILNNLGIREGESTFIFESKEVDGKEEITKANYTLKHRIPALGYIESVGDLTVVEFTDYKKPGDTKYFVSCICTGAVEGTWNGARVNNAFCNCLFEVTLNTDGSIASMTCVSCTCTMT